MADFNSLNEFFDHIYVLTLKRSTDRQAHIEKTLAGLAYHFFYGVDKEALNYEELVQQGLYDDHLHRRTKRTRRSMNLGEIACALSHRAIYEDMAANQYQQALILEDDAVPIYENLYLFDEIKRELPENWELLMLGYYGEKQPSLKNTLARQIYYLCHYLHIDNWHKVDKQWIRDICLTPFSDHLYGIGKVVGAHAYAMTLSAAKKFIDYQQPVIVQADRIFNYYKAAFGLEGFASKVKLFTLSGASTISYISGG